MTHLSYYNCTSTSTRGTIYRIYIHRAHTFTPTGWLAVTRPARHYRGSRPANNNNGAIATTHKQCADKRSVCHLDLMCLTRPDLTRPADTGTDKN